MEKDERRIFFTQFCSTRLCIDVRLAEDGLRKVMEKSDFFSATEFRVRSLELCIPANYESC